MFSRSKAPYGPRFAAVLAAAAASLFLGVRSTPAQVDPAVSAFAATAVRPAVPIRPQPAKAIPYTVRPGDSIGTVAAMFGISPDDLARANRIAPDDELISGDVLHVPNPFASEVATLRSQVATLNSQVNAAQGKTDSSDSQIHQLKDQVAELRDDNDSYQASLKILPWWRATAITMGGVAIAFFVVAGIAMFEWWRMRRKLVAVAELSASLTRLDYKYKSMIAKVELRLQQLYGRRRAGMTEGQPRPKLQEEMEIERLDDELREILRAQLEKLGAQLGRPRKRSSVREMRTEVDPAAEPHTIRR
jgi:LysM repeat protein